MSAGPDSADSDRVGCKPLRCSGTCRCRVDDIIDGQYIEIAMPVKNAAMSGLMPLLVTVE